MKPLNIKISQHAIDRWNERGNNQDLLQEYKSSILYGGQLVNKAKSDDSWLFITTDETAIFAVRKIKGEYWITTILTPHQAQANIQTFNCRPKHKRKSIRRKFLNKLHKEHNEDDNDEDYKPKRNKHKRKQTDPEE